MYEEYDNSPSTSDDFYTYNSRGFFDESWGADVLDLSEDFGPDGDEWPERDEE